MDDTDRRLRWLVAASVLLHGAALLLLPGLGTHRAAPRPPLLVRLAKSLAQPVPAADVGPVAPPVPRHRPLPLTRADAKPAATVPLSPIAASPSPSPDRSAVAAPQSAATAATTAAVAATAAPAAVEPAYAPPQFAAAYLANPPPAYPAAARRRHVEGLVRLEVFVGRDGHAREVKLAAGSGSAELDGAAREAVMGWRFVPARRGDESVDAWVVVPVCFRLGGTG